MLRFVDIFPKTPYQLMVETSAPPVSAAVSDVLLPLPRLSRNLGDNGLAVLPAGTLKGVSSLESL